MSSQHGSTVDLLLQPSSSTNASHPGSTVDLVGMVPPEGSYIAPTSSGFPAAPPHAPQPTAGLQPAPGLVDSGLMPVGGGLMPVVVGQVLSAAGSPQLANSDQPVPAMTSVPPAGGAYDVLATPDW